MGIRARLLTLSTLALLADTTVSIEPIEELRRIGAWRVTAPRGEVAPNYLHQRLILETADGRSAEVFFSRFEGARAIFRGVDPLT